MMVTSLIGSMPSARSAASRERHLAAAGLGDADLLAPEVGDLGDAGIRRGEDPEDRAGAVGEDVDEVLPPSSASPTLGIDGLPASRLPAMTCSTASPLPPSDELDVEPEVS